MRGGSFFLAMVLAVISGLLGVAGGIAFLASVPAKGFLDSESLNKHLGRPDAPESPMPTDVYFLLGPDRVGDAWEAKRVAFIEGGQGVLELNAADLNGWFRKSFRKPAAKPDPDSIVMAPSMPDFYIEDGVLHLSCALEIAFFGKRKNYRIISRGDFDNSGDRPRFVPTAFYVNNAKFPLVDGLLKKPGELIDQAFGNHPEYQAIKESFAKVEKLEVGEDRLLVYFR